MRYQWKMSFLKKKFSMFLRTYETEMRVFKVREWLAATFTRQTAVVQREKPKFKSVANAIRTGIFFDK